MGFSFRKSINLGGGSRLNISKSGIGFSTGVKGFRYSTGPRGSAISVGRGGVYYRKQLSGGYSSSSQKNRKQRTGAQTHIEPSEIRPDHTVHFKSADVSELVESTSSELIDQLNHNSQLPSYAPIYRWCFVILSSFATWIFTSVRLQAGLLILIPGLIFAAREDAKDIQKRITPLMYDLQDDSALIYGQMQKAFAMLAKSQEFWQVESVSSVSDPRRNAGAAAQLQPLTAAVYCSSSMPFIETNLEVPGIVTDQTSVFFFPDQILVLQDGMYGAGSYETFRVEYKYGRWVAEGRVPTDSEVLDYTWLYVNKNGSQDKRFNDNREVPVLKYGYLNFVSESGLNLMFQLSNAKLAEHFCENFAALQHRQTSTTYDETPPKQKRAAKGIKETSNATAASSQQVNRSPHEVLEVDPNASESEIKAAYRKLVKMYHPDKVAGLGHEFNEMAEKRMSEINSAFEELASNFSGTT